MKIEASSFDKQAAGLDLGVDHELTTPEYQLKDDFAFFLERIDFEDVMHLHPHIEGTPRNLADYRFVPITSRFSHLPTLEPQRFNYPWPQDVYPWSSKLFVPYVDAQLAIGLVYRNELNAVSAAGLTSYGALRIKQLQGVINVVEGDPDTRKASGLHSGVDWRKTFVQTWLDIAAQAGMDMVEIQSAVNNYWVQQGDISWDQLMPGYDRVAREMGFLFDPDTDNFHLHRRQGALTVPRFEDTELAA